MKKKKGEERGITLIALVVTIIVLLILASVTIHILTKTDIYQKTIQAKEKTELASQIEENTLQKAEQAIDTQIETGAKVYIPDGFFYVGGTIDEGIVISDIEGDDMNNTKGGNQFVWIPVDGQKVKWQRINFGKQDLIFDVYEEKENAEERASIIKHGGFYLARFEAGSKQATEEHRERTEKSNIEETVISQKNSIVYNFVTQDEAEKLAKEMIPGKTKLVSSYAWDATMQYVAQSNSIFDSRQWGNYSDAIQDENSGQIGSLQKTGCSPRWKVKNIYDLAGNAWEWTSETCHNEDLPYVLRGGYYGSGEKYPVVYRFLGSAIYSDHIAGFRVMLYE